MSFDYGAIDTCSDVRPFVDNIENVNRPYNEPSAILADGDAIYILPIDDGKPNPDDANEDGA